MIVLDSSPPPKFKTILFHLFILPVLPSHFVEYGRKRRDVTKLRKYNGHLAYSIIGFL